MADDQSEPRVPIVCSACETETRVALSELAATLQRHNEQRHGGDDVAQVDPELAEQIADLAADDLGLV